MTPYDLAAERVDATPELAPHREALLHGRWSDDAYYQWVAFADLPAVLASALYQQARAAVEAWGALIEGTRELEDIWQLPAHHPDSSKEQPR